MSRRSSWVVAGILAICAASLVAAPAPATAGGGAHCPSGAMSESDRNTVVMQDACFNSTITNIDVGESVTFENKDAFPHNVVGWNGEWGQFDNMRRGDSFSYEFTAPGVYPFACYLHYGMTGAVVVGEDLEAGGAGAVIPASAGPEEGTGRARAARPVAAAGDSIVAPLVIGVAIAALTAAGALLWSRRRAAQAPAAPTT